MGKYGKKSVVIDDPSKYIIGLLGESGVGKTTTMCKACDKLFGEDGYIILDMGKEDGMSCLPGYTYETVGTFKASAKQEELGIVGLTNLVEDIVANKGTDYPNLRLLIADTIDQAFDLAEMYSIAEWNAENRTVQGFKPCKTINGTWGGAGKNFSHVYNHVLNLIWKLKSVGVGFWYTGHVKQKQIDDVASGKAYTQLTTNMMNTYFNSIKTKTHILGIAYVDRDIVEENTGKKNLFTKKDITKNVITDETRKIKFRDDNYSIDSKSRFANIVDEINLDADEFIQAITDAINNSKGTTPVVTSAKKSTPKIEEPEEELVEDELIAEEPQEETTDSEDIFVDDELEEEPKPIDRDALAKEVKSKFGSLKDADLKNTVKGIIAEGGGLSMCDIEHLQKAMDAMN